MSENIFKFEDQKVAQSIPLEVLRESVSIETANGKFPRNRPIESWDFVSELENSLKENDIIYNIDEIYVDPTYSKRMLTRTEKESLTPETTPVDKWLFETVVGKISFPNNDSPDFNGGIAYSFNKRGLNVAWGTYVQACSNMSIWGNNLACTYKVHGKEAIKYDALKDKMANWLNNFDQKFEIDKQIVQLLMDTKVMFNTTQFIGALYVAAIKQSYMGQFAPFDTHAVSTISQKLINDKTLVQKGTGWDLYNMGTEILKPETSGTLDIWENTSLWSDFIFTLLRLKDTVKEIQSV